MKKLIYGASLLTIIGSIIFGCQKESLDIQPVSKNSQSEEIISTIRMIGTEHNAGLDAIYNHLLVTNESESLSKLKLEEILNITKEGAANFFESNKNEMIRNSDGKSFYNEKVNIAISNKEPLYNSKSSYHFLSKEDFDKLSDNQKEYLVEIENSINENDFELTIESLKNIESKAILNLSADESIIIITAVEVGINSFTYWHENLDKWNELLGNKSKAAFSWGSVGKSDVAGAVGGAVGAAVVNVIPGAGQVGYVGAIAGGAIGNSAVDAVGQLLDSWF